MRFGHVWFGVAGKAGNGCVSYGELKSGLLRYGMAGKVSYGWFVSGVLGSV